MRQVLADANQPDADRERLVFDALLLRGLTLAESATCSV